MAYQIKLEKEENKYMSLNKDFHPKTNS